MRRLLVVAGALGLMASLHALRVSGAGARVDPLTLAAIGFVVLSAFTVGELGKLLRLPKVTGYIVAGIILGPFGADILAKRVVSDMQVFNTLALGLIATTAGLELNLGAIRKVWRTLAVTVLAKIPLLLLLVGGALVATQKIYPFLTLPAGNAVLAMGLIFAVLGIGTSPAIALAVTSEARTKGRLTDLVLAIAVVKDIVVVIALAVALAVARSLTSPDASLDARLLLAVGQEIGSSLLAGALLGALFIAYMRFIRAEMLFFVVGAVLVAAELARALHLELLLVFITAGFVVHNFSDYEHDLLHSLERVALPVFVVFFTTAGASLDLRGTVDVLPLAGALVVARLVAYFFAGALGARVGREPDAIRANAWFAYTPQAGVTLGLVLLAAKALPQLAGPINQLGMAVVSLNLLIGPVLLAIAMKRAGEVGRADAVGEEAVGEEARAEPSAPSSAPEAASDPAAFVAAGAPTAETASMVGPTVLPPTEGERPALDAAPMSVPMALAAAAETEAVEPTLAASVEVLLEAEPPPIDVRLDDHLLQRDVELLEARLKSLLQRFVSTEVAALAAKGRMIAAALIGDGETQKDCLKSVQRLLAGEPPFAAEHWEEAVQELWQGLALLIQGVPAQRDVALDPALLAPAAAPGVRGTLRRLGRRLGAALGFEAARLRRVPLRLMLRVALEPRISEALAQISASWYRTQAALLLQVRLAAEGDLAPSEAREAIGHLADDWRLIVRWDLDHALRRGLSGAVALLERIDSPALPPGRVRYSQVEPTVTGALSRVHESATVWRHGLEGVFGALRVVVAVEAAALALDDLVERRLRRPVGALQEHLVPAVEVLAERLRKLEESATAEDALEPEVLERLLATCEYLQQRGEQAKLRNVRGRFRRATLSARVQAELAQIADGLPEKVDLASDVALRDAVDPGQVDVATLNLARVGERQLLEHMLPALNEALGPLSELVARSEGQLRELVHVASYGIELAMRGDFESDEKRREALLSGPQRARARCEELAKAVQEALQTALDRVESSIEQTNAALRGTIQVQGRASTIVKSSVRATREAALEVWQHTRSVVALGIARLARAARGLSRRREVRDWLIRSGQRRLDAVGMRAYVDEFFKLPDGLPPLYAKLFSPTPLEDRRMFVAYREQAEALISAVAHEERDWILNVLIVGTHGSGRSSLLNVAGVKFSGQRVLQLDPLLHGREEGIVAALAAELGCGQERRELVEALVATPTVVVVDDLEHYLVPGPEGVFELTRFIELMVDTARDIRWIVTTETSAFQALNELVPLEASFGRRIDLPPLSWGVLREVVEGRQRLAAASVGYLRDLRNRLIPWRRAGAEPYFRALARTSGGNLRAALFAHLRSLHVVDAETLMASVPERVALPLTRQLPADALAILSVITRYGPISLRQLRRALLAEEAAVARSVLQLEVAGLLEPLPGPTPLFRIAQFLETALSEELALQRIVPRVW